MVVTSVTVLLVTMVMEGKMEPDVTIQTNARLTTIAHPTLYVQTPKDRSLVHVKLAIKVMEKSAKRSSAQ